MNEYAKGLITKWEGCELDAYDDGVGVWTIGYGHIVGVAEGLSITQGQADYWLEEELLKYETSVLEQVGYLELQKHQMGALISFTYNVGISAFQGSTLLKVIKEDQENYDDIAREFLNWDNAGGSEMTGLSRRRINEANCYANGTY